MFVLLLRFKNICFRVLIPFLRIINLINLMREKRWSQEFFHYLARQYNTPTKLPDIFGLLN